MFPFLLLIKTSTLSFRTYKYHTYLKTSESLESLLFNGKRTKKMAKYAKIAFITQRGVFPIFCCPGIFFTKKVITRSFSISTGFMMAHFEAKKHGKTIESPKSSVVEGQMSAIL